MEHHPAAERSEVPATRRGGLSVTPRGASGWPQRLQALRVHAHDVLEKAAAPPESRTADAVGVGAGTDERVPQPEQGEGYTNLYVLKLKRTVHRKRGQFYCMLILKM